MINKIVQLLWNILNKIPRLKQSIYKFYAWRIFEIIPTLKKLIYKFYDKFWYLELSVDINDQYLSNEFPNELNIDISRLKYYLDYNLYKNYKNLFLDEKWDKLNNLKKIAESKEYSFLNEHFSNKKKWEEIDFYKILSNNKTYQKNRTENSSKNQFPELLDSLDKLYHNFDFEKIKNKIQVVIGRNGDFILIEGIFYLLLLDILKKKNIPIQIVVRHPQWIKFCNEFLKFQAIHGEIYQPLIHPDLNLKTAYYSDKRFEIIKNNLDMKSGTVLDIGANLGFFCHNLEDLGFDCYAVEVRPSNVYFMKKLRDIEGKKFKIINKSIFDLKITKEFDIVIALNIFHHFLREKKLYFELVNFLKKLKIRTMFFQPHNPNEKIMQNAYVNYSNQEFVDFIINYSCLNKAILLNEKVDGRNRPIYKIIK
ncbi:MAG: class I SAM-dependent methyltransferase [Candidatus Odinarchaeota archaeon]